MKSIIVIENLKCHGCANTITKSLSKMVGVTKVEVDHETSSVSIEFNGDADRTDEFARKLKTLGYPMAGDNSAGRVAKSFLSCAIGRMDSNKSK